MPLPAIPLPNPRVTPAVAEKVYDRAYIEEVLVRIPKSNPNGEATAVVKYWPALLDENGQWELDPSVTDVQVSVREGLLGRVAAGDTQLGQAFGAVMQYVGRMIAEDQIPKTPPPEPVMALPPKEERPKAEKKAPKPKKKAGTRRKK